MPSTTRMPFSRAFPTAPSHDRGGRYGPPSSPGVGVWGVLVVDHGLTLTQWPESGLAQGPNPCTADHGRVTGLEKPCPSAQPGQLQELPRLRHPHPHHLLGVPEPRVGPAQEPATAVLPVCSPPSSSKGEPSARSPRGRAACLPEPAGEELTSPEGWRAQHSPTRKAPTPPGQNWGVFSDTPC